MATPTDLIALTWLFSLSKVGIDQDIAEFTVNCHRDDFEPDDPGLLKLAEGGFKAWANHMPSLYWTDNVFLSQVSGRTFLANGHTNRLQTFIHDTAWVGTGSHPALPWETSLALSLYTYPRGSFVSNARRKRGRIYLPPMASATLDSSNSGFFDNTKISDFLASCHTFMSHVGEDDIGVKIVDPGVYSRTDGVVRDVIQLSIDAKFDSQRRRQNRETAGHIEVAL